MLTYHAGAYERGDPDICPSQDYCDSNPKDESDADVAIWSEAWTLARKLHLGHPQR